MSRIVRLSAHVHRNDLGGRVWNPLVRWTEKFAVFVRLEDEDGQAGIGECWCFDASPEPLLAYLRTEVAPHLIGLEVEAIEAALERLRRRATLTARHGMLASLRSGVDIALWDLRARRRGVPVAALFDPAAVDRPVTLYASGGLYGQGKGVAALVDEMTAMSDAGYSLSKMKVGGLGLAEDLERANAVIAALPPDRRLIVDGVYGYTPAQALALYAGLPDDRIEAFQSPVAAEDIDGMAWLAGEGVPVMASEAEYRVELHRLLVERGAVAFLQVAPIACGGLSRLRELAALVDGTPVRLSLEVSSTAIALMAACQFAAAHEVVAHVERHALHRVFFEALALRPVPGPAGRFGLPATPGLGIELPEGEVIRAFETLAPGRARGGSR